MLLEGRELNDTYFHISVYVNSEVDFEVKLSSRTKLN